MENDPLEIAKKNYINLRADLAKNAVLLTSTPLKTPQQASQQEAKQAEKDINALVDACEKSFSILFKNLQPEEQAALVSSLEPLKDMTAEKIQELMNTHLFVHQALGISDEAVNRLYQLGKKLLEEQAFEDAEHIFFVLAILCPQSLEVWLGLGKVHQDRKQYREALQFYEKALELNPRSSLAQSFINECNANL